MNSRHRSRAPSHRIHPMSARGTCHRRRLPWRCRSSTRNFCRTACLCRRHRRYGRRFRSRPDPKRSMFRGPPRRTTPLDRHRQCGSMYCRGRHSLPDSISGYKNSPFVRHHTVVRMNRVRCRRNRAGSKNHCTGYARHSLAWRIFAYKYRKHPPPHSRHRNRWCVRMARMIWRHSSLQQNSPGKGY